jgi:hypothetical protein
MLSIRTLDSIFHQLPHLPQRILPFPLQPQPRDPCPPSAAGRTQAKKSSPSAANPRSNILDSAPPALACREQRPGHCQTRNRCRLASGWLSVVWRLRSRPKSLGRPKIDAEVRALIRRMVNENPSWGAPRIHGELLKLGFDVSERTVSRYLRRLSPPDDARKRWSAFLRNHREVITAMDFFTVPTLTFRVLRCFFVIEHGRRKILHFNVTEHPTGPWIAQQLREAFPGSCPYRYAILDGDAKFGKEATDVLTTDGMKPVRISPASPWQNGVAERWIGSCRRASRSRNHPQ